MNIKIPRFIIIGLLLAGFSMTAGCGTNLHRRAAGDIPAAPAAGDEGAGPLQFGSSADLRPGVRRRAEIVYYLLIGEIAGQRKRYDIAARSYLKAALISSDPRIARRAMRIAVYARDLESARKAASRWSQLEPRNTGPHRFLVTLYLRLKQPAPAISHLQRLLDLEKDRKRAFEKIYQLLGRARNRDIARQVMDGLLRYYPRDPWAHFARARLAVLHQDFARAENLLAGVLKRKPDLLQARILYAGVLIKRGKTDVALQQMKRLVDRHAASRQLRLAYARLLAEARRYRESRAQFEYLLRKTPANTTLLYGAALLGIESRQYDQAEHYLKRLLATGGMPDTARYYLGVVAEQRKRYTEALKWFRQVKGNRRIDAAIRIAVVMSKRGEIEAARRQLYRIPARNARLQTRLLMVEAEILSRAKRYKDAMAVLDHGLKRHPGHLDLLYARALLAEKMNRLDITERDLRKILEKKPDDVQALNALGYTLADRNQRLPEALGYIRKAYRLSPNEPAVIDSLGWVYYRLNQPRKALDYLRRAYRLEPDPEIAAHLGEVLWRIGRRQEARRIWHKARRRHPDNKVLNKTIRRFLK